MDKLAKKVKILIVCLIVLFISFVACLPFFVNYIINKTNYDPTKNLESNVLSEQLTLSLCPEIYSSNLVNLRNRPLNYGKYEVRYGWDLYSGQAINKEQKKVVLRYNKGVVQDIEDKAIVPIKKKSDFNANESEATLWEELSINQFYFAYFKLNSDDVGNSIKPAEDIYNHFITEDGDKLVEWVGYNLLNSDYIWGVASPKKQIIYQDLETPNLFSLFTHILTFPEAVDYISDLMIFGCLEDFNWEKLLLESQQAKPDIIMMFGLGEDLLSFQHRKDITLIQLVEN